MYKIVMWNHDEERPIEVTFSGYKTKADAWEEFPEMKERFEQMLIADDYADGSVYEEEE